MLVAWKHHYFTSTKKQTKIKKKKIVRAVLFIKTQKSFKVPTVTLNDTKNKNILVLKKNVCISKFSSSV